MWVPVYAQTPSDSEALTQQLIQALQTTISLILQQITNLQEQLQVAIAQNQSQNDAMNQMQNQMQQTLGAIQQNTTPIVTPPSTSIIHIPVKDLIVSTDKNSVVNKSIWYDPATISAIYTEDGKSVPTNITFSAIDASSTFSVQQNDRVCGNLWYILKIGDNSSNCVRDEAKVAFSYIPQSVGTSTVTVTSNGITKTIEIVSVPYIKVDSIAQGVDLNNILSPKQLGVIGRINFTSSDEPILIKSIQFTTNLPFNTSGYIYDGSNEIGAFTIQPNMNMSTFSSDVRVDNNYLNTLTFKIDTNSILSGNYNYTITGIKAFGVKSGSTRDVQGLPISFHFTIQ